MSKQNYFRPGTIDPFIIGKSKNKRIMTFYDVCIKDALKSRMEEELIKAQQELRKRDKMTVEKLTAQVTSSVATKGITRANRIGNAESMGLKPIGANSVYADLVAFHPDLTDVVIKIAPRKDRFYDFARAVEDGTLSGCAFPKFHSITVIDDKVVYVMERLEPLSEMQFYQQNLSCIASESYCGEFMYTTIEEEICAQDLGRWTNNLKLCLDLHKNNLMRRGKQIVFLDPVA